MKLKRIFTHSVLALSLTIASSIPYGQAAIGIAFGPFGIGLDIVGGISIAASIPLVGIYADQLTRTYPGDYGYDAAIAGVTVSSLWLALGIVLLDGKKGDFQYTQLDPKSAQKLKLSAKAVSIYNSEVDQLNAIVQNVAVDLKGNSNKQRSKEIWESYSGYLQAETFAVAKVISSNMMKQVSNN